MSTNKAPESESKKPSAEEHSPQGVEPFGEDVVNDTPLEAEEITEDNLTVTGREDEASSAGHRVEPIFNDEEGNAQELIEEGLHGYTHVSKKDALRNQSERLNS